MSREFPLRRLQRIAFYSSLSHTVPVLPPEADDASTLDTFNGVTRLSSSLAVRDMLLEENEYNLSYKFGQSMPVVKYVTIHNTWGFGSARDEREYLNRRRDKAYVSFHFAVDETEIIRIMNLDVVAWHAGDSSRGPGNSSSVGIEICRSRCIGADEWRYRGAEANAVILSAYLLKKFGLGIDSLKKHQDWSGKYCPHRILDENRWDEFKSRVSEAMR